MSALDSVSALALVGAAVCVLAALTVLWRCPKDESTAAFILSALVLALLCVGLARGRAALSLRSGAWMYLPVSVWWLATTFGRRHHVGRNRRWAAVALLGVATVLGVSTSGYPFPGPGGPEEAAIWGRWAAILGVGFWLAAAVNLLLTMRGAVGEPRLRQAAAIVAFTCFVPLWPATVVAASGILPQYSLWVAAALLILSHLAMAEWLTRHRAREGDLEFGRPVSYVAFAVFLFGLYLLVIGGMGKAVEWLGGDIRAFLSAFGGVVVAVLGLALATSGRVWERIRAFVDQNFYRGEFDFRSDWMTISEELSALPDPRDLGMTLNRLLSEHMRARTVFLYRKQPHGLLELWSRRGGASDPPERLDPRSEWADWLWRLGAPTDWSAIDADDIPEDLARETRLVVPLIAKQEIVALACLGGRDESFRAEERLWLEAAGQQAALAVLAANLTERLIETRELASFHRLSAFVIHDVKNAVSMLSLLLQNLERGKSEVISEAAKVTVRQATDKLTSLIDRFSSARESFKLAFNPVNLTALAEQTVAKVGGSFPGVEMKLKSDPAVRTHGDATQISRVIENLLINACEAMQGKGHITVETVQRTTGAEVIVADTGPGMEDDFVRERLFRPFATTKKKGLGIGLFQSREIARAHGGDLTVASTVGEGSTFRFTLPGAASADHA